MSDFDYINIEKNIEERINKIYKAALELCEMNEYYASSGSLVRKSDDIILILTPGKFEFRNIYSDGFAVKERVFYPGSWDYQRSEEPQKGGGRIIKTIGKILIQPTQYKIFPDKLPEVMKFENIFWDNKEKTEVRYAKKIRLRRDDKFKFREVDGVIRRIDSLLEICSK